MHGRFGKYIDVLNEFVTIGGNDELLVLVLQFSKIKIYRGEIVVQNVMDLDLFGIHMQLKLCN